MVLLEQEGLDQMTSRGPFQFQPFCDSTFQLPRGLMYMSPNLLYNFFPLVFFLSSKSLNPKFGVMNRPTSEVSSVGVLILGPGFG